MNNVIGSENILNCSNISDCGVPESSVAQSALAIGCRILDGADSHHVIHKERTVSLTRGKNGFGFNIVGGEEGDEPGLSSF